LTWCFGNAIFFVGDKATLSFIVNANRPMPAISIILLIWFFSFLLSRQKQITIESFTLGKFVSYTQDGCPDGYLQMSEAARTPIGGMWCGQSWGPAIFYSETRSLVLTVKLFK
jgi:hypothetical protein